MIRLTFIGDHAVVVPVVHKDRLRIKGVSEERIQRVLDYIRRDHGIYQVLHFIARPLDRAVLERKEQKRHDKRIHSDEVDIASDHRRDLRCRENDNEIADHRRDKHRKQHNNSDLDLLVRSSGHTGARR